MRICIFGAGAVGSHFAVRLALAGHDVSCVMRGPHLAAVKANGLKMRPAHHAGDVMACLGKADRKMAADGARAENADTHGVEGPVRSG